MSKTFIGGAVCREFESESHCDVVIGVVIMIVDHQCCPFGFLLLLNRTVSTKC